ncbi:MAG: hypothetical protein HPY50_04110 [Firmicutes bacterium]|nr:hypothetical protein [Bacillota bacterium]
MKPSDLRGEFEEGNKKLRNLTKETNHLMKDQKEENDKLDELKQEMDRLYIQAGVENPFSWDSEIFLEDNEIFKNVSEAIYRKPNLLPVLNPLDIAIVGLSATLATLLDFLVVKIPKDITYLDKFQQKGSSLTSFLRTVGVDEDGKLNSILSWLEKSCKVPYDQVKDIDIPGFHPRTHRLLGLGHDPFFGLLFGIFDILNGSLTGIDENGAFHVIKTQEVDNPIKLAICPIIWLGHIISDMCTKMGIPIPGWGFLQLIQMGDFGKGRTVADISRWMYLKGYDLRHFVTMAITVASIELIVRGYNYLEEFYLIGKPNPSNSLLVDREIFKIQRELKLHKMLFFSHSAAASGNALKVVLAYQGNPLAINTVQWAACIKESVTFVKALTRDTTAEQILINRALIDQRWEEINKAKIGTLPDSLIYLDMYQK